MRKEKNKFSQNEAKEKKSWQGRFTASENGILTTDEQQMDTAEESNRTGLYSRFFRHLCLSVFICG